MFIVFLLCLNIVFFNLKLYFHTESFVDLISYNRICYSLDMAEEIQDYLNYIKSLGFEAWIPDTPGYGHKMSVADQCRSKVLCLNYKGVEIYIRGGCTLDTVNKCSTCTIHTQVPAVECIEPKNINQYLCTYNSRPAASSNASSSSDEVNSDTDSLSASDHSIRSVDIQYGGFIDKMFKLSPISLKKLIDFDNNIETGYEHRRIVNEKLTREVRVAKCYVSSLPNVNSLRKNSPTFVGRSNTTNLQSRLINPKIPDKVRKSGPIPGFVRQLTRRFDGCDNVEQQ